MTRKTKINLGIGAAMLVILGFTANYIRNQVKLLMDTDFNLASTKINELSLKNITMTLWWRVGNKSDIGVTIDNQVYDIYINGVFIKKVGYGAPVKVHPRSETDIPTYISFAPKEVLEIIKSSGGEMNTLLTKEGRKNTILAIRGHIELKTSIFEVKRLPIEWQDNMQSIMN